MRKITRLLLIALVCLISINSSAQTFGVRGGLNMADLWIEDYESDFGDKKMNPGFHFGLTVDVPFSDVLSVETGLLLSTKGLRITETDGDDKFVMSMNNTYLDVPVTIKYTKEINETMKIYGAAGPYIGLGLSGKYKYKETYDGDTSTETEELNFGNDEEEDDLKSLDYGLTFGGGVYVGVIRVGIYFDLGLANISLYDDEGLKNRVLRFSAAYSF